MTHVYITWYWWRFTWLSTQDCRARSRVADRTSRVIIQHVWPWTIVSAMIREHIARFCRIWKRVVALQPQQQAIFSSPTIYAYFSSGSLKVATLVVPFLCCFCLVFICCWTSCMQYLTIHVKHQNPFFKHHYRPKEVRGPMLFSVKPEVCCCVYLNSRE